MSEIVPFRYNYHDLNISFDFPTKSGLSLTHLKGICNAWHRGIQIDYCGRIWICQSQLHTILRTTRAAARYLLLEISDEYQLECQGEIYIQGSEIYRSLDVTIQSAGCIKKEKYARFSEEIYRLIRDSDKLKTIRYEFYEEIESHKKNLKQIRIRELKLGSDELTGDFLDKIDSDFSHIRNAKMYLPLADRYWNGLVVNKETHKIITKANINDEDELYELCVSEDWNTEWYSTFSQCLNERNT
jgi:hypothetical protein